MSINVKSGLSVAPARANINKGIDIQSLLGLTIKNSVNLHEDTWFFRYWSGWILMPFLPFGESGQAVSSERSFDRGKTDLIAVLEKKVVEDFGATLVSFPIIQDGVYCFFI